MIIKPKIELLVREIKPDNHNGRYLRENLRRIQQIFAGIFEGSLVVGRASTALDLECAVVSIKPTYSGSSVIYVEGYSNTNQIVANRLCKDTLVYNDDNKVGSITKETYSPRDGSTVLKTVTQTLTYTDGKVSSVVRTES